MGNAVTVAIETTPLERVGGVARIVSNAGSFLVTRTGETTLSVLTNICSHDDCSITDTLGADYVCHCHGSRFDRDGGVKAGPAELPLTPYEALLSDRVITIRF